MRIISKFQDYYDSALAYGFENDRVLVRHTQTWNERREGKPLNEAPSPVLEKLQELAKQVPPLDAFGKPNFYEKRPKNRHLQITPVVFCVGGRVVKALWLLDVESVQLNQQFNSSYYRERGHLPQLNPMDQHQRSGTFEAHPSDKVLHEGPVFTSEEFKAITEFWVEHYAKHRARCDSAKNEIERLHQWLKEPAPDLYLQAIAEHTTIALATREGIALNPSLKDWRFFKYWDAATCMQELSMFVGNMSMPDNAPQIMDDKYRVHAHGFDEQSFRKQPTKHGLPKRAKRPHPDNPSSEFSP